MNKQRLMLLIAVLALLQIALRPSYAGYAEDPLGFGICLNSDDHCGDCYSTADRTILYSWSSAPIEQYEEEYTRYYIDRRCCIAQDVEETIHEQYSEGQSVEKSHSWTAGLSEGIVIDKIFSLSLSLSHTNTLTFACNAVHEHAHDWTLSYTKPAGRKGYFVHNYVLTGDDYTLFVASRCVNEHSGHMVIHSTGSTHGVTMGYSYPKLRNRYLVRDVEQPFNLQNADCTACDTASMYCNGTSCTSVVGDCKCEHND